MRLARGGRAERSANTSLRSGMCPSTLRVFARGSARRLAQKARVERNATPKKPTAYEMVTFSCAMILPAWPRGRTPPLPLPHSARRSRRTLSSRDLVTEKRMSSDQLRAHPAGGRQVQPPTGGEAQPEQALAARSRSGTGAGAPWQCQALDRFWRQ